MRRSRIRGGNWRIFCVSIITPPLLTLNMRETESMKSDVKINNDDKCEACFRDDVDTVEGHCADCRGE